jgi:hypothetical protein
MAHTENESAITPHQSREGCVIAQARESLEKLVVSYLISRQFAKGLQNK